jgi:hypothetical protein
MDPRRRHIHQVDTRIHCCQPALIYQIFEISNGIGLQYPHIATTKSPLSVEMTACRSLVKLISTVGARTKFFIGDVQNIDHGSQGVNTAVLVRAVLAIIDV